LLYKINSKLATAEPGTAAIECYECDSSADFSCTEFWDPTLEVTDKYYNDCTHVHDAKYCIKVFLFSFPNRLPHEQKTLQGPIELFQNIFAERLSIWLKILIFYSKNVTLIFGKIVDFLAEYGSKSPNLL
jgi:hypothetical protein